MGTRITQHSFTGGEIAPDLYARTDISKYGIGLATLKNGFVKTQGGVFNRAGLEFCCEVKDSSKATRIIPFAFNSEQQYIIEVGNQYFRFLYDGSRIVEAAGYGTDIVEAVTYKWTASGSGTNEYYLEALAGGDPSISEPVFVYEDVGGADTSMTEGTLGSLAASEYAYGDNDTLGFSTIYVRLTDNVDPDTKADGYLEAGYIVETASSYLEAHLFNLKKAQDADVLTICHNSYAVQQLTRSSFYSWPLSTVTFAPAISAPINGAAVWTGGAVSSQTYKYKVTAVKDETYEESNTSAEISQTGEKDADWGASDYMTITWDAVTGATEYNIYKEVNGIYGFIGSASTASFVDDKITPDLESTAPITQNPFSGAGNYPAIVSSFQQRKVFANTTNKPRGIFATQTGTDNNFNISRPLLASDAITITVKEEMGQVNEIKNIIPMNDLIVFTAGSEFKVNGSDGTFSASPPPQVFRQSSYGCSDLDPIVSGNMILYAQAGRSIIRNLGYTYVSDSYDGDELTLFANHLFEGKQIVDWAYSKEPFRILWAVMSDGTLNALTYDPKQEVLGWHQHETEGSFESVAVIREGYEDVPYFVVNRTINGQTKRYIERMKSRIIDNTIDGFFVDCGVSYSGVAKTTMTNLSHLEGEEVVILADGGVVSGKTVSNGTITLNNEAENIVVGLPYEFEMKTLNFESDNTQGLNKKISNVNIKIHNSREDFIVVGSDGTEVEVEREIASINDSSLIFSKDIEVYPVSDWSPEAYVHIKQPYPLPLTVLAITPEIEVEEVA